ncbi:MAG: SEL1-like repeat protein [Firmicutes bacterium]|nr:SEL1-like repeat protein [Bacillota bacterium]
MIEKVNPKSLNDLGDKYFNGINNEKNIEVAYTYYKQAADVGNPLGLYNVGKYFIEKKEYKLAIEYLQKAMACGYTKANLKLASMAVLGEGFHKNKKKAFKFVLDAAKQNDTFAYNQVASYYLLGIGCKKDTKKAWEYYQKSADLNNIEGMYQLGLLYLESTKNKSNPETALHWLDKAAVSGLKNAMIELKKIYSLPHPYFLKKSKGFLQEMIFYYDELLAKTGELESLKSVSISYYEGTQATKQNFEKSIIYFKKLMDLDEVLGYYGMGVSLLYGQGILQNSLQAKNYLEISAGRGYQKAMTRLGDLYRMGINIDIDFELAKTWYFEAAKQNDPDALMNLGLLHYRKQINNSSFELAFQYMENASKKGYFQAYYWMGIFYDKGIGCDSNFSLAEKAFQRAIQLGSLGALYKYAVLLFEKAESKTLKPKKQQIAYSTANEMFLKYVLDPQHSQSNSAYSMVYLAEMYENGKGVMESKRISRYWFELAAESGLSRAMVKMYQILQDTEYFSAYDWLQKAVKNEDDGEAFYEMGLLYYDLNSYIAKDLKKARAYFESAAKLKWKPAFEKLMMM